MQTALVTERETILDLLIMIIIGRQAELSVHHRLEPFVKLISNERR